MEGPSRTPCLHHLLTGNAVSSNRGEESDPCRDDGSPDGFRKGPCKSDSYQRTKEGRTRRDSSLDQLVPGEVCHQRHPKKAAIDIGRKKPAAKIAMYTMK